MMNSDVLSGFLTSWIEWLKTQGNQTENWILIDFYI